MKSINRMKTGTANQLQKWISLAGILAPVLYVGMVIILGLLEPGYNQRTKMMSILGGVQGWR